jgi:hypothetical protein
MHCILILFVLSHFIAVAMGQADTASIAGAVLDETTNKPADGSW